MANCARLVLSSLMIFECLADLEPRSLKFTEPEPPYNPSHRSLNSFTPNLKIKLTDPQHTSHMPVVILQDPCTLSSYLICLQDPAYTQTQIPTPITIPLSSSSSDSVLVYEFSGYYTYPITLDIYYHTLGAFTQRLFSGLDLNGSFTQSSVNNLYFTGEDQSETSTFYLFGYLKGPRDGSVDFTFYHDDIGTVWINQNRVYYNEIWGERSFRYEFVKDMIYYIEILVQNTGGRYGLGLRWNLIGSDVIIDESNMIAPVRLAGMPYMINELKYNTYCDDVSGL